MAYRGNICNQKEFPNFLSLFQDRWTEIVAYRGAILYQKGCLMVHWIKGKLYKKNKVLTKEIKK